MIESFIGREVFSSIWRPPLLTNFFLSSKRLQILHVSELTNGYDEVSDTYGLFLDFGCKEQAKVRHIVTLFSDF